MIIIKQAAALQAYREKLKAAGKKTAFVPTMGALHRGHISLVETASRESDIVICSIFVNPTQFNDPTDFAKYPVTIEQDIYLLEKAGTAILFLPSVQEMYPNGIAPTRHYDLGYLETVLEGAYRPGHFQGVCQVVHRLLDIVMPDSMYLGQKDYQQCMVLKQLVALLALPVQVHICPTLREDNGLAMSSRNMRLTVEQRQQAAGIFRALSFIKENLSPGRLTTLETQAAAMLNEAGFRVNYIEIADANTLALPEDWDGKVPLVALAAAFLGDIRLIDNLLIA
jgi:pantoate--beta-alanine ligase